MTIHDIYLKFKEYLQNTDILLSMLIVIVALVSFGLGRFSVQKEGEVYEGSTLQSSQVIQASELRKTPLNEREAIVSPVPASLESTGGYVASKSGTKYHLPWCAGAKQIKESNKIFFATKEEAEKAGYTPASNCKGI